MDAIFRVDGTRVIPSPNAAGPLDPTMQHGSAPAALVAWAAEAIPAPQPMQVARLTIDLMRPVPLTPLTVETEILRAGRKMQVCEVRLLADGVTVVRTNVQEADNRSVGVDWHVAHVDGGLRIVDVVVEGVSLGQTQRDDFAAYLHSNNNDVGKLTALLRQRRQ